MLSIISLIRSGEYLQAFISILSRCFVVFFCMPFHEYAHGYVAKKLGDNTAYSQGRLTLNPLAHLTPIGTIMIFLFGIGYANPVPINPNRFKNPKKGMALTALAGPLSNLLLAFVSIFVYYAFSTISFIRFTNIGSLISLFFFYSAYINVTLAIFNLFPIPPLDGSKILAVVLTDKVYFKYMQYERYIMLVLMVLLFSGVLSTPISFLSEIMMYVISIIPRLIFSLF